MKSFLRTLSLSLLSILLSIAVANPVPGPIVVVNELLFAPTGWQLELFPLSSGPLDGLWIRTRTDSAQAKPGLRSVNNMAVITSDSLIKPLSIDPLDDQLSITLDGVPFDVFQFGSSRGSLISAPPAGISIAKHPSDFRSYYFDRSPTIGLANDTIGSTGRVLVRVTNSGGTPITGASVYSTFSSGKTDSIGEFHICCQASFVSVSVYATDYRNRQQTLQMYPDCMDTIRITLYLRTEDVERFETVPTSFGLRPNYPNPFNAQTTITIDLPTEDDLTLEVFNLNGERLELLVSDRWIPGVYRVHWDGTRYAAGVYFVRAATSTKAAVQKIVLLK